MGRHVGVRQSECWQGAHRLGLEVHRCVGDGALADRARGLATELVEHAAEAAEASDPAHEATSLAAARAALVRLDAVLELCADLGQLDALAVERAQACVLGARRRIVARLRELERPRRRLFG